MMDEFTHTPQIPSQGFVVSTWTHPLQKETMQEIVMKFKTFCFKRIQLQQ